MARPPMSTRTRQALWILPVLLLGGFLFYWYEIRPIRLYRQCAIEASTDARALLRSKAQVSQGTPKAAEYQRLIDQNLYLRSDYESFLKKCLLFHGLPIAGIGSEPLEEAAAE
jgi:hypothetical protein